jgi:hypothetical protein
MLSISSDTQKMKGYYVVAIKYERLNVGIPFCHECAAKLLRNARYGKWLFIAGLVAAVAVGIWLDLGRWQTGALGVVFIAPALWLMYYGGQQVRVSNYSDETITFSFKHPEYAQEFIALNGERIG